MDDQGSLASTRPTGADGGGDATAVARLMALPTAGLGHWPTPLHRLDRFGAALGAEVWAKRDDVQGVALAGNKVRKFDLVVGRALSDGRRTLVTTGAVQSNSARAGAAAAAAVGMSSVLVLGGDEPDEATANVLLDRVLGSEVRFAGPVGWATLDEEVERVVGELEAQGRAAFGVPVGCSSPLGSLGFAKAFLELDAQCREIGLAPAAIVHASTSGGTHAGLLVGRSIAGRRVRIVAVDVGALYPDHRASCLALAEASAELIGHRLDLAREDLEVLETQLGDGYARPTAAAAEAIALLARTEAIVTDPVYSGKGLAGLVELARAGRLEGPVVFWHTGGYHALFDPHHAAPLLDALRGPAA